MRMWDLAPPPLKTLYLPNQNGYDHQTWESCDIQSAAPSFGFKLPQGLTRSRDKLNMLLLHLRQIKRHQTWQGGDLA